MTPVQSILSRGRRFVCAALSFSILWSTSEGRDILRSGSRTPTAATAAIAGGPVTAAATTAPAVVTSQDRLAKTTQALQAVKAMQLKASGLAKANPSNVLRLGLNPVPVNSWNKINGLMPATGVPKDLLKPVTGEDASLWIGAKLPTVASEAAGSGSTTVTIQQTEQQAVLNWQSFNIDQLTTLYFDQTAGGTNAGQWIAFNKIGVTGSPSQILGSIKAEGQVYVINPNGIIFGGSSQVNTHALIASSLPINDNLVQRGLLNNPDSQFLFSALAMDAGKNGTAVFTPVVMDEYSPAADGIHQLNLKTANANSAVVKVVTAGATTALLKAGDDYNLGSVGTDGKTTLKLTAAGLSKTAGAKVQVSYTPLGDQYGDVEVQAGATLTSPTNADHVGGRVALIGKNVSNAGTISTNDGQTILAAGLQVAFAQHNSADATLRGLDVYVGAVEDPALDVTTTATDGSKVVINKTAGPIGLVTNAAQFNTDQTVAGMGLINAARGAVTLTGKEVQQNGFIESSTSVAYNGRVDLVAGFNAVANPQYDASQDASANFLFGLPYIYQSSVGNDGALATVKNSGQVRLGHDSVVRVIPETSTDRVAGDLSLPSQINIQGEAIYFDKNSVVMAPGAAVPIHKAYGADGRMLEAGVTVQAGAWINDSTNQDVFSSSNDRQQIYVDQGAVIDVAGSADVQANVSENIVSIELRGAELANSPLQRDGLLRGQTIQVDLRQHGDWDDSLNDGKGGYKWVGTPLADTSGWVGLATHTAEELTVNGGSVSLRAGGAVILQTGSTVNVSGGSINFKAGDIQTTKVSADGHIYDIAKASPDRKYDGIYSGTTTTTDPKWGTTQTTVTPFTRTTHEGAYTQGGSGGSLSVSAPVVALDGTLKGNTVAGEGQRSLSPIYKIDTPPDVANPVSTGVPGWLVGALSRPLAGQFSLKIGRQYKLANGTYVTNSPMPANIEFLSTSSRTASEAAEDFKDLAASTTPAAYLFPAKRKYRLELLTSLFDNDNGSGFGIVKVDNSDDAAGAKSEYGNITVKAGTALTLAPGGSLILDAGNITVEKGATIVAESGRIALTAYDISPSLANATNLLASTPPIPDKNIPLYNPARGNIVIQAGAKLSAAGGVVDDRLTTSTSGSASLIYKGGAVELNGSSINLEAKSTLDVSGGAILSATGKISYGDAGKLTLKTGTASNAVVGGGLKLSDAALLGFAGQGKSGGKLSIQAPAVLISTKPTNGTNVLTDATGKLTLAPEFFSVGGFSDFSLTGLGIALAADGKLAGVNPAVTVADNTVVKPTVLSWESLPGGSVYLAPESIRQAVNLTLKTVGELRDVNGKSPLGNSSALVVGKNSEIATEVGGSVTLSGGTVDVLGRISTPAGSITVTQGVGAPASQLLPAVHFGAESILSAAGAAIHKYDITGKRYKSDVLDGGNIVISGNIVAERGALFDVSGSSASATGADPLLALPGILETSFSSEGGVNLVPTAKESNGGTISLTGNRIMFVGATLLGGAGTAADGSTTAGGGTLTVSSRRGSFPLDIGDGVSPRPTDPVLIVSEETPKFYFGGLGVAVKDVSGTAGKAYGDSNGLGMLWIGADSINPGKFGTVVLSANGGGAIQVQGKVALTASRQITAADGGVLSFFSDPLKPLLSSSLVLNAPYVKLGLEFPAPQTAQSNPLGSNVTAQHGTGQLTVNASTLIDVGTLSLQNAGTVILDATVAKKNGTLSAVSGATTGAIRGNGTLDVAGDITLKAGQIYPPTAVDFNVIAEDYTTSNAKGVITPATGSITVQAAGNSAAVALPLSAEGGLNLFASTITQGGTLRAPLGTIQLGAGVDSGVNPLSGASLPTATTLILQPGSITSVSSLDPTSGKPVTIPYGINVNGDLWIDPKGADITSSGPELKSIALNADAIDLQAAKSGQPAAAVDVAGGGDLLAYQFVPGAGGKIDILLGATSGSFAIVPGYTDSYAPLAGFGTSTDAARANLGKDTGYVVSGKLSYKVGDRIYLDPTGGKNPQNYTLLPARYALLPGAYLVTLQTGAATVGAISSVTKPDGSVLVAGYRFNALDAAGQTVPNYNTFEVATQAVVLKRAEYKQYSANTFFANQAKLNGLTAPRLPVDAGRLSLLAGSALNLDGTVQAKGATGGRGGLVDLSSTADIVIGSAVSLATPDYKNLIGTLLLDAKQLSDFGAESLLIGGVRSADGTTVTVNTDQVKVDNAGEALTGSDVILVANKNLVLMKDAEIGQTNGTVIAVDPLKVSGSIQLKKAGDKLTLERGGTAVTLPGGTGKNSLVASSAGTVTDADGNQTPFEPTTDGKDNAFTVPIGGTVTLESGGKITFADLGDKMVKPIAIALGDGVLVRVSNDPAARIVRSGVASSTAPKLTVGAGVKIAGVSAIFDSTQATDFSAKFDLSAVKNLALDSGRVSVLLENPGAVATTNSLVLSRDVQQSLLKSADSLSILSYSTLDFYGSGTFGSADLDSLALHAGAIRGYPNSIDSTASTIVAAKSITLDNAANDAATVAVGKSTGKLLFDTATLRLGGNQLEIQNYAKVELAASGGILAGDSAKLAAKTGGFTVIGGDLTITTPLLAGASATTQSITAIGQTSIIAGKKTTTGGALTLGVNQGTAISSTATVSSGLGAKLSLSGTEVVVGTALKLPSGTIQVEATTGNLTVANGTIDVSGTAQHFYEVTKYTDGGSIDLKADAGDMAIKAGSKVTVAANAKGGSAGTLTLAVPLGHLDIVADTLSGAAGTDGKGGALSLDTVGLSGADPTTSYLATLSGALAAGGFDRSIAVRVRQGNVVVDGVSGVSGAVSGATQNADQALRAHEINLSADHGSITVTGRIDASGLLVTDSSKPAADPTGGIINLSASGDVVLLPSAVLSAVGYAYDNAGKGGAISLSAGSYTGQVDTAAKVDVRSGAVIDLGVKNNLTANDLLLNPGVALPVSNRTDLVAGTLHVRESQIAFNRDGNGAQFGALVDSVSPERSAVRGVATGGIVLEGYQVFDLSGSASDSPGIKAVGSGGLIDSAVQKAVKDNGTLFVSAADTTIFNSSYFHIQPGAEIVNTDSTASDLTLNKTWDLSAVRFGTGTKKEPGNLTLRAQGNLDFGYAASLNDGFSPLDAVSTAYPLWSAKLMSDRSWSYRLLAGADYSGADAKSVQSVATLDEGSGSVRLGVNSPALPDAGPVSRSFLVSRYFQTIRTGTGDIEIAAGRDVQLLNPLATIYTAGRKDGPMTGFDVPVLDSTKADNSASLFPYYVAQYSLAGGNVTVRAQHDIGRYRETDDGLVADSTQQMPTNWLYRRGNVGTDGKFVALTGTAAPTTEIQSTSWWVDFSNFFADTGALGGGNVTLVAGGSISNVDAAVPTNARMPGKNTDGKPLAPDFAKLLELGGGNVTVRAGADIDGGVYYVERGTTSLSAGRDVKTNSTRTITIPGNIDNPSAWLATTFFLGKGKIEVAAGGEVQFGTVANPFWLPQGSNNRAYEKTFFSTYDQADSVAVSSLGGNITFQGKPDGAGDNGLGDAAWLQAWYANVLSVDSGTLGEGRPWLRLADAQALTEAARFNFNTVAEVRPGTLRATAFAGDINLLGQFTFAPSPVGSVDLLAAKNLNGLGINGGSASAPLYGTAVINLSDADPKRLPGVASPLSFPAYGIDSSELNSVKALFTESGTTTFSLEQKLALHGQTQIKDASGKITYVPLHFSDSEPLRLYAAGGDLSGLTLYSAKSVRVLAKNDITDISLYAQNVGAAGLNDTSVVAAGHDIIAYDPASALRVAAQKAGGVVGVSDGSSGPGSEAPAAGDIQIAGSGTLEVLAGRNLILGSSDKSNRDGTGVGITSVGSIRNTYLPQNSGASIVAAAGVGAIYSADASTLGQAPGLATTGLDFGSFIAQFLDPATSGAELATEFKIGSPNGKKFIDPKTGGDRYLTALGALMGLTSKDAVAIWAAFNQGVPYVPGQRLSDRQAKLVLQVFQLALRDAARDRNDPENVNAGTYKNAWTAIKRLFPNSPLPTLEDLNSKDSVVRPATGPWAGQLSMSTRLIKTFEGGDISLLVPGGEVTVGRATDPQKPDQGVLTERGGGISIFAADSVNVGTSRIFTLRGGNEILWSSWGNIAAGSGSKTVYSAPPTRVLVDPQSGDVQNDLAGLATGSGIGVLATLTGVDPGDVDLIAPVGTIDAGDAGIRSSGNLNIAARVVLNAGNIQVGGSSAGTPPPPAAPNLGALTAASTASSGASSAAADVAKQSSSGNAVTELPSMISVEVLGYGGDDEDDDEKKKNTTAANDEPALPTSSPVLARVSAN